MKVESDRETDRQADMQARWQTGRQALHLAQAAEKKQLSGLNPLQSSQPHTSNTCPCEELSTIPPIAEKDQATMLNDCLSVCLSVCLHWQISWQKARPFLVTTISNLE